MTVGANQWVAPAPSTRDERKALRLLAVLHFAYGGVMLLVVGFVVVAYLQLFPHGSGGTMGPAYLPLLGAFGTFVLVKGVLVVASAVSLLYVRFRALSQVAAALCVINFPLGTLLGISTLTTLARASVVELYRSQGPP
jgi:hypothetical protein